MLKPTVKIKGQYWEKISRLNVKVKESCKKVHGLKKREEEQVMFYNKISPVFLFNYKKIKIKMDAPFKSKRQG